MTECKIIAHRGANRYAPQNTMPAFERANELGADGYETDVHLTRDGVPVICHNYTVNETSTGMGSVSSYSLEEIRRLDFGSYYSDKFKGTRLPTLEEFLTHCETADIEIMNIELKSPHARETDIVEKTIEAVKAHGLMGKLLISSFDYRLLVRCKETDPYVKTGYLYSPDKRDTYKMFLTPVTFAKKIGADYLHPVFTYVTPGYVRRAHKEGIGVNVWTVDSPAMIRRMLKCGVDGIITNCPDRAMSIRNSESGGK